MCPGLAFRDCLWSQFEPWVCRCRWAIWSDCGCLDPWHFHWAISWHKRSLLNHNSTYTGLSLQLDCSVPSVLDMIFSLKDLWGKTLRKLFFSKSLLDWPKEIFGPICGVCWSFWPLFASWPYQSESVLNTSKFHQAPDGKKYILICLEPVWTKVWNGSPNHVWWGSQLLQDAPCAHQNEHKATSCFCVFGALGDTLAGSTSISPCGTLAWAGWGSENGFFVQRSMLLGLVL